MYKDWILKIQNIITPAMLFDESEIISAASNAKEITSKSKCKLLYSVKACSNEHILNVISDFVDGFSCSSIFESFFINDLFGALKPSHFVSPGISDKNIDNIYKLNDFVSFNSLNHWGRYNLRAFGQASVGLRINPQCSFVQDHRYDPCSDNSKLGVGLDVLTKLIINDQSALNGLEGIHIHNNSESTDYLHLLKTIRHIDNHISSVLEKIKWVNLGGGYYFDKNMDYEPFEEAVYILASKYDLDVIVEPGTAIVQESGCLVSEIIDIFKSDGRNVAVLDTTVNHLPEVLEFQYKPDVMNSIADGEFEYILSGNSCLSGDKFGSYHFNAPLEVGDRLTFTGVGSYSLVKSHMFNGINLPSVYCRHEDGKIDLIKEYFYEDFLNRYGDETSESLRKRA